MSLEYFEPRPPKSVAIKLDFLDGTDSSLIVLKLREVPGVYSVDIQHCDDDVRRFVINARGVKPGTLRRGFWLVSTPNDLAFDNDLKLLSDSEFQEQYRPCEPNVHTETMVVDSGEEHAVMPTGNVEYR